MHLRYNFSPYLVCCSWCKVYQVSIQISNIQLCRIFFPLKNNKSLPLWSQCTTQSHYTSLGSVMKESNRSCVTATIPKHELDSHAIGKSSEKELNLVSSETAFLCSAASPPHTPKMLCLISDHNVMVMTQKQRKPGKRGAHFPLIDFLNPRFPFCFPRTHLWNSRPFTY